MIYDRSRRRVPTIDSRNSKQSNIDVGNGVHRYNSGDEEHEQCPESSPRVTWT